MFDAEYGDEKKIITLLTNPRALTIWEGIRQKKGVFARKNIYQEVIAENTELGVSEIKQKLMEIFHKEETIKSNDFDTIRGLLVSELFFEFENIVHWRFYNNTALIDFLTRGISKEEAMKGQFPLRCFTQDLYNLGYDNDMVRRHQLLWAFEEFWSTLA